MQRGALGPGPDPGGRHARAQALPRPFGWVGDTLDAKQQRDDLEGERDQSLERQVTRPAGGRARHDIKKLAADQRAGRPGPVRPGEGARDRARSGAVLLADEIDKGSSAGVAPGSPSSTGRASWAASPRRPAATPIVTLITDEDLRRRRRVPAPASRRTVQASINKPGDLELELVDRRSKVRRGDLVNHRGLHLAAPRSPVPAGHPDRERHPDRVRRGRARPPHPRPPAADLRRLDTVEVLTRPHADLRASAQ